MKSLKSGAIPNPVGSGTRSVRCHALTVLVSVLFEIFPTNRKRRLKGTNLLASEKLTMSARDIEKPLAFLNLREHSGIVSLNVTGEVWF